MHYIKVASGQNLLVIILITSTSAKQAANAADSLSRHIIISMCHQNSRLYLVLGLLFFIFIFSFVFIVFWKVLCVVTVLTVSLPQDTPTDCKTKVTRP